MKKTLLILFAFILADISDAQPHAYFIYGTISTIDDKTYTGPIRWDDEEVFWTDFFNATKSENKYHEYLDEGDLMSHIQKWFSWDSDEEDENDKHEEIHKMTQSDLVHMWVCQFGDIRSLKITGRETVDLTLKNGSIFHLNGGSNDLDTDIKIHDEKLGELTLKWDRINVVEFRDTPKLTNSWGDPLYGTVHTTKGDFTGFIQWDHDERLSTDKLDGHTEDGEISVDFGNIKSIAKNESGSKITLKSGRSVDLHGSNDVNKENRGIIVTIGELGRVDIPWSNFEKVDFEDVSNWLLPPYSYFKNPQLLSGKVFTNDGKSFTGTFAYDLDEEYDFEMIQGKDEDLEYSVILRHIGKIVPKNFSYSQIILKNGQKLLIGDSHDVSDTNSGVLVFESGKDGPTHIKWENVKEVVFD